jgi:hypothetical protein
LPAFNMENLTLDHISCHAWSVLRSLRIKYAFARFRTQAVCNINCNHKMLICLFLPNSHYFSSDRQKLVSRLAHSSIISVCVFICYTSVFILHVYAWSICQWLYDLNVNMDSLSFCINRLGIVRNVWTYQSYYRE